MLEEEKLNGYLTETLLLSFKMITCFVKNTIPLTDQTIEFLLKLFVRFVIICHLSLPPKCFCQLSKMFVHGRGGARNHASFEIYSFLVTLTNLTIVKWQTGVNKQAFKDALSEKIVLNYWQLQELLIVSASKYFICRYQSEWKHKFNNCWQKNSRRKPRGLFCETNGSSRLLLFASKASHLYSSEQQS